MRPEEWDFSGEGADKWGSFLPVLKKLIAATKGPILEVGVGWYSTPYLSVTAWEQNRSLHSIESDPEWGEPFRCAFEEGWHTWEIAHYNATIAKAANKQWSIVLLDHSPGERRGADLAALAPVSEYLIIHDYHLAIEEAAAPIVATMNSRLFPTDPPTLVCSMKNEIPDLLQ